MELIEKIKTIQNGSKNELLELIDLFQPLIKKYSAKLQWEEGESSLTEFFIELIYKINPDKFNAEPQLLKYIKKSIYHRYIALSKKQYEYIENEISSTDLLNAVSVESDSAFESMYFWISINELEQADKELFYYFYVYGYTVNELSQFFQVSEQKIYNRLLELKEKLREKGISS